MCGIVGMVSARQDSKPELGWVVEAMAEPLCYRGPDNGGVFVDAKGVVVLACRVRDWLAEGTR